MFKILISLFLITGAGVIFFTESKSYFSEIKILRTQVVAYNETINTAKKVKSSIDKTLAEYNAISQNNVDRINKMIPSEAESMKLVVQIDNIMRKNGLSLKNIDTKDIVSNNFSLQKKESKIAESISLSMKAQGSYESFYSFIKELEKNLRLIEINSIKISSVGAGQDDYLFSIEAVSYWQKTGEKI